MFSAITNAKLKKILYFWKAGVHPNGLHPMVVKSETEQESVLALKYMANKWKVTGLTPTIWQLIQYDHISYCIAKYKSVFGFSIR